MTITKIIQFILAVRINLHISNLFFCRNLSCAWRFDSSRNTSNILYTLHHKGMVTTPDLIQLYGGKHSLFCLLPYHGQYIVGVRVVMVNDTFNNISVISWRSVLLVEGTGCARRKMSTSRTSPRNN
jgi:hypothetical protein